MHEIYLAEQVVQEIIKKAQEEKAKEILEATIAIPKNEHFTEKEFKSILENQAIDTIVSKTKFNVIKEDTPRVYLKDIKVHPVK